MQLPFIPDLKLDNIYEVDGKLLREMGIRLLISDLDNTIATYENEVPDEKMQAWADDLRENGITLVIVSNNKEARVSKFCIPFGTDHFWKSGKPSRRTIRKVMEKYGETRETTALIGDKIVTDIIGAKRSGVLAIKVPPLGKRRLFE